MYLLDTNHCSYIINGSYKQSIYRKDQENKAITAFENLPHPAYTCDVVVGEMYFGAETSTNPTRTYQRIETFLLTVSPVITDKDCWLLFAKTKVELNNKATPIKDFDLLIACIAHRYGYILVSNDLVFKYLPTSFQVENWVI